MVGAWIVCMSGTYASPLDLVERGLDELAAIGPEFRTLAERREFLLRVARVKARVVAEELRVLAASDDIAEETGDRSTAVWLATQTRDNHGTVRRHAGARARPRGRGGPRPPTRWVPVT